MTIFAKVREKRRIKYNTELAYALTNDRIAHRKALTYTKEVEDDLSSIAREAEDSENEDIPKLFDPGWELLKNDYLVPVPQSDQQMIERSETHYKVKN